MTAPSVQGEPAPTLGALLRRPLAWTIGLSVAMNLLVLTPALFMLQVFDRVLVSRSPETLVVLLAGVAVALALLLALDYLRSRLQAVSGQMLGDALMPVVARRQIEQLARRAQGTALPVRDVATLRQTFATNGLVSLFDAPWLVLYVAVIALAHPLLGATAAVAALLMVALAVANSLLTRRGLEQIQAEAGRTQGWLDGAMRNAELTQALGMTDTLLARWSTLTGRLAQRQRPTARRAALMAAAARTLRQSVQVAMLAVGAWLVIGQQASPGVMIAATVLLGRALAPVEQVVASWGMLVEARAAWGRLTVLLDRMEAEPERMALPSPQGGLSVQSVGFRPAGAEQPTLAGVSIELAPGEALAVVGPSGSGKSTLARLLIGVWRPSAGAVRLDGVDLAQWDRAEVGPAIGYLPQDVQLFAGTVAENIARLGEADSQQVVRAAVRARVHELILSLPEGYDTVLDPQAALISPGQRQRIGLARALYGDPKLVVLDEPNANLDGEGEIALGEALKALHGSVTVVVVTHRSNLVQHMDRMLVLEAGRVRHYGRVEEVIGALSGSTPRSSAQVVAVPRTDRPTGSAA